MKTTNPTRGLVGVLAPMLAVWLFLAGAAPAQAQEPVDAQEFEQTLRVSLWHGKDSDEVYRRGEPLNVTFQANEDAYAVVYHIDVEGRVSVLWPTSRYSDGFVFGGHEYRLPSRGGEQLRTESEEGQGFFHAVVSSYPFDLRDLDLDFHHEPEAVAHDFYVAGDPFLAMNEVNYVVTGLEDPSQYAVSNYTSYYVHRPVDHPRYLCFQCHDGNESYDPYQDTCTITIEYDYGWHNQWWDNRGYYPVYYYPAYVYVDPWAGVHWVNYWYDPWYRWPSSSWYSWRWDAYAWQHSPYWRPHDARVARKYEDRRYRPLDRDLLGRDRSEARTKSDLVRDDRPSDERIRSMKERTVLTDARSGRTTDEARDRIRGAGGTTRERVDRERQPREQERFEPRPTTRSTSPGLRLDGDRTGGSRVSRPPSERNDGPRVRTDDRSGTRVRPDRDDTRVSPPSRPQPDRTQPRVSPRSSQRGDDRQTIRPVQPRQESNRNWSTRRSQGSSNQRPSPPPPRVDSNRESRVRKPDPPRNTNQGGSSGQSVQPRTPSKPPSKPAPPPKAPSRSGGGDRTKQRSSGGRG